MTTDGAEATARKAASRLSAMTLTETTPPASDLPPSRTSTLVVCFVGTDHHRFDRLIGWCDELTGLFPGVEVLVQHGRSALPTMASGVSFFDKSELTDVLSRAHCAISHGGPGLISEIRAAGLLPIAIPRDPQRGEHVDGHQQKFVAKMARIGHVLTVSSLAELQAQVARCLAEPRGAGLNPGGDVARVRASVLRFAELVEDVLAP